MRVLDVKPLPSSWRGRWALGNTDECWYDEKRAKTEEKRTLRGSIRRYKPEVDSAEVDLVVSVLSRIFRYDPTERITAAQLKSDPGFRAMMQLEAGGE